MKPSDEQLREICVAMNDLGFIIRNQYGPSVPSEDQLVQACRAAFEASCKLAADRLSDIPWIPYTSGDHPADAARKGFQEAVTRLRSLTAPEKDDAVEAVKAFAPQTPAYSYPESQVLHNWAVKVVETVRKADSK